MATHSIILAWRIPWTEEAGGPQSIGSQSQTQIRDIACTHACKKFRLDLVAVRRQLRDFKLCTKQSQTTVCHDWAKGPIRRNGSEK